ncbi:MAG: phospholipase effector Tle1 domain-containing protein, partial [Planctomycetota bacterium]
YTVRALAGMLKKCGLLQKGSKNLIPYASRMYRKDNPEVANGFKETFSRDCEPHFVGVWDTVKSVGLFFPRKFPHTELNPDITYGYHALSIDEQRIKFRPNLWDKPSPSQTIEQVWFAGVHSDVGGFYPEDGLSNIALKWMVTKASDCGLKVDKQKINKIKTDPTGKLYNSLIPFYWILGWKRRNIPNDSFIHKSVYERIAKCKEYMPKNLPTEEKVKVVE